MDLMNAAHFHFDKNKNVEFQSVYAHLEETSILSEQFAEKIKMPKTGKLLGILHDSGKYSGSYQSYLQQCKEYEQGMLAAPPRKGSVDHGIFGAVYVMEELCGGDGGKPVLRLTAEVLAMVIAYHHGGLQDYLGLDTSTPLWDRIEKYKKNKEEEYQQIKIKFEQEFSPNGLKELFSAAGMEVEGLKKRIPDPAKFRFHLHLVIKFLYSCLIDADREDTRRFMEGAAEIKKTEKDIGAEGLPQKGEQRATWNVYEQRLDQYLKKLHEKPCKTESENYIRSLREDISDACYRAGEWPLGVYKLTVPTGGGKTLASMRMALRHMQKKAGIDSGHIYQILPFTAIIEQNAAVIRTALHCRDELLEHHSNIVIEESAVGKEKDEEENNLSREQYRLLTERWNVPFVFSTMVQFLNTVYGSGTQSIRRMHNLANSVIIMDEIQALPLKTMKLFGELVDFLVSVCNTTILLCTATQPNLERLPIGIKTEVKEIVPNLAEKFEQFKRMEVVDKTKEEGYTIDEAVDFIQEEKAAVRSLLVVMNTKKITRKIYEELQNRKNKQLEVLYLTTELCPAHRTDIITYLKELLEQKKDVICVSTSILEAGVDVSFEGVIRNIAGLDSIAQSSGRGNRHGENANRGLTYVINVRDERLGSMVEIEKGEEKTKAVFDTFKRIPEAYDYSLLSPKALSDYYQKYFAAGDIKGMMDYPVFGDSEMKDLYSYFTKTGDRILRQRYDGRYQYEKGKYRWQVTYPFKTAGEKFRVIAQDTVSVLVPYGKGKEFIEEILEREGRIEVRELSNLIKKAHPYFVSLYTDCIEVYQNAVITSPLPGVLLLRDGYYDEITGIKEEQNLEFLSF